MRLEWSTPAKDDLARVWEFNAVRSVARADAIDDALITAGFSLLASPRKGRPGRSEATRELSMPAIQYVIVYELDSDIVRILHVWSTKEQR